MSRGRKAANSPASYAGDPGAIPGRAIHLCSACKGTGFERYAGTIRVDNQYEPKGTIADRWIICKICKGTKIAT